MVCFDRAAGRPLPRATSRWRPLTAIANTERRLPDAFINAGRQQHHRRLHRLRPAADRRAVAGLFPVVELALGAQGSVELRHVSFTVHGHQP